MNPEPRQTDHRQRMLEQPVLPLLRSLTWPMLVGIVALLAFSVTDTWFVSRLGTRPLAALGFSIPVSMAVTYLGVGLGIGTSATVARALGAGLTGAASEHAAASLLLALAVVVPLAAVGLATIEPLFRLLGAPADLLPLIRGYMQIWYVGMVFVVLAMVGNATLRALGDTRTVGLLMLLAALLNLLLDPLLIFGPGPFPAMGLAGAALASVIGWAAALCVGVVLTRRFRLLPALAWPSPRRALACWREQLAISAPAAAANMLTPLANGVLTAAVAGHGAAAVAAWGVGTRIEGLALLVVLALTTALPPLVSQNLGAGLWQRVREAIYGALRFAVWWELAVYVVIALVAWRLVALFTDDPGVAQALHRFLLIVPLGYGCQGVVILAVSSFNALHAPRQALLLALVRWFGCYVPLALAGGAWFGLPGLFAGAALGNAVAAAVALAWLRGWLDAAPARALARDAVGGG